jgi:hypothetical protein
MKDLKIMVRGGREIDVGLSHLPVTAEGGA